MKCHFPQESHYGLDVRPQSRCSVTASMWNRDERRADYITQPSLALVDATTVAGMRGEGGLTITGVS